MATKALVAGVLLHASGAVHARATTSAAVTATPTHSTSSSNAKNVKTFSEDKEDSAAADACKDSLLTGAPYEMYKSSKLVCRHGNFATWFGLDTWAPDWSAYKITADEVTREHGGRRQFKPDPDVPADHQADVHSPCWGQTWNRGHLCPSYIMSWDKRADGAWADTYFITNTAMQAGHFNQGPWVAVEKGVWSWIETHKKSVYIVTGTLFDGRGEGKEAGTKCDLSSGKLVGLLDSTASEPQPEAERNLTESESLSVKAFMAHEVEVSNSDDSEDDDSGVGKHHPHQTGFMGVPDYYYKMLCDPEGMASIWYVGHNRVGSDEIHEYSVADVEKKLGLKLLPAEACGTSSFDVKYWFDEAAFVVPTETVTGKQQLQVSADEAEREQQQETVFV